MKKQQRQAPRHPLDIFEPMPNGKIRIRPRQTRKEFDDWYDNTYGYGSRSNRILIFVGIIVFAVACFVVGLLTAKPRSSHQQQTHSHRQR